MGGKAVMQMLQTRLGQLLIWITTLWFRQAELRHASATSTQNQDLGSSVWRRRAQGLRRPWAPSQQSLRQGGALAWAEHGLAKGLNCAFAALRWDICLEACRKMSKEEFCSNNINLILHEVKSIFVLWAPSESLGTTCCLISLGLGYLPPFPPQSTGVFTGNLHFPGLCLWTAVYEFCS